METAKEFVQHKENMLFQYQLLKLKKDFSGYILDPLQNFKFKGKGTDPYITEKSIIKTNF